MSLADSIRSIMIVSLCLLGQSAQGDSSDSSAAYQLQKNYLLTPKSDFVNKEKDRQSVFIYEGMKLSDVETAMDTQFDRIEHMMFILTRLPPTAAGGEETVEDDCD